MSSLKDWVRSLLVDLEVFHSILKSKKDTEKYLYIMYPNFLNGGGNLIFVDTEGEVLF